MNAGTTLSKPKKLEFSKTFKPLMRNTGDEFFPNGIFEFNITKLLAFIAANPSQFPVEQISVRQYPTWGKSCLDEATVEAANIETPIVLGEISPGRFNVIDGNHRLEKARRLRLENVPAYRVAVEQHLSFLTSEKAYVAFVKFWNTKIDDLEP